MSLQTRSLWACMIGVVGVLAVGAASASDSWQVTELPFNTPTALNDVGQVVGTQWAKNTPTNAYVWQAGAATFIRQDSFFLDVDGINNAGTVLGDTAFAPWTYHVPTGAMQNLPGGLGFAYDINEQGVVLSEMIAGDYHAALYTGGWPATDLGAFAASRKSRGNAINDLPQPQVVGWSDTDASLSPGASAVATLWNAPGVMVQLTGVDHANDINNLGEIVGDDGWSPILRHPNGAIVTIPRATGWSDFTTAVAINDSNWVVGTHGAGAGAFLYRDGATTTLNDLLPAGSGWNLTSVADISNNGWIVGTGYNPDGAQAGYLLTPVPEPASLALLGLGGLALLRRR